MRSQKNNLNEMRQEGIEALNEFTSNYGKELVARLLFEGPFSSNMKRGVTLGQVRYKTPKKEKIKTEWLTNQFKFGKK